MIKRLRYAFCVPLPKGRNFGQQGGVKAQRFATEPYDICVHVVFLLFSFSKYTDPIKVSIQSVNRKFIPWSVSRINLELNPDYYGDCLGFFGQGNDFKNRSRA